MMYKNVGRVYVEPEGLAWHMLVFRGLEDGADKRYFNPQRDMAHLYAGFDCPFTYAPPFFYLASILYSTILYPFVLSCVLYSHL